MEYTDLQGNKKTLSISTVSVVRKSSLNPKIKWLEVLLIIKDEEGKILSQKVLDYKEVT